MSKQEMWVVVSAYTIIADVTGSLLGAIAIRSIEDRIDGKRVWSVLPLILSVGSFAASLAPILYTLRRQTPIKTDTT